MAAYQASRHDWNTPKSLGGKTRNLDASRHRVRHAMFRKGADLRSYDGYVDMMKERLMDAYADVQMSLRKAAESQEKYYDL